MRAHARFEDEVERQGHHLAEATGAEDSQKPGHGQMPGGLLHFAAFVGHRRSGRRDIASNYKTLRAKDARH